MQYNIFRTKIYINSKNTERISSPDLRIHILVCTNIFRFCPTINTYLKELIWLVIKKPKNCAGHLTSQCYFFLYALVDCNGVNHCY